MTDNQEQELMDNMERLQLNPKWSDMTIVCEEQEFKCHRNIMCQSRVMKAELTGNFQESNGIIKHDEYGLETVERMIRFLYTGDYDDIPPQPSGAEHTPEVGHPITQRLIAHANVHGIASYYDIPSLKVKAVEKAQIVLQDDIPKISEESLVTLLETIYMQPKSEDAGLRPAILDQVKDHLEYLVNDEHLINDFKNKIALGECCFDILALQFDDSKTAAALRVAKDVAFAREISSQDSTIAELRNRLAREQKRADAAEGGLTALTNLLAGMRQCYRCNTSIDVSIGRGGKHGHGRYFVRCSCGAKHNAP